MNDSEALETIGRLIKAGRLEMGLAQVPFSKLAEVDTKTLATMEKGTRVAWETNQRKVEAALGWRLGSIQEVLDDDADTPAGSVTLETMRYGATEPTWHHLADEEDAKNQGPVTRASLLQDDELLMEFVYRFRNYKSMALGENRADRPDKTD